MGIPHELDTGTNIVVLNNSVYIQTTAVCSVFKIFALTLTLPRIPQTNLTQLEGFNQRKQLPLGLQQRLKMHLQAAFQADIQETDTVLAQVNRLFLYGVCGVRGVVHVLWCT